MFFSLCILQTNVPKFKTMCCGRVYAKLGLALKNPLRSIKLYNKFVSRLKQYGFESITLTKASFINA